MSPGLASSLSILGEFGLIRLLQKKLGSLSSKDVKVGIGDDSAVLKEPRGYALWTHDLLLQDVHFLSGARRESEDLGYKALAVNLSDIAAMGGRPRAALVGLGIPRSGSLSQVEAVYRGLKFCAAEFSCGIVGGDTNRSKHGWVISVTVLGHSLKKPILRSGARPGDILYVTGRLGSARLGWEAIRRRDRSRGAEPFRKQHRRPRPRVEWGLAFSQSGMVSAMLDVSDGLAGDLRHLARASSVGFAVDVGSIPRHPRFERECRRFHLSPLKMLLEGGEDYELLFTVRKKRQPEFERWLRRKKISAVVIGRAVSRPGLDFFQDGKKLRRRLEGFSHF